MAPCQRPRDSMTTMAFTTLTTTTNKKARPSRTKNWTKNSPAYYYYTSFSSLSRLILASTKRTPETSSATSKRIVICGGGIGGLSTAFDARRHLLRPTTTPHDDTTAPTTTVTVVSDREQFQFTPSNPWVAVRKRTAADISISLRETLKKHQIDFIHAKIIALDPQLQHIVLDDGTKVPYDYLVIATGPRLAFDEIPCATRDGRGGNGRSSTVDKDHQFLVTSICTTPHAVDAAKSFDRLVQNPGPVVVGAVPSASCFGPAYEYAMLLQHELKKRGGHKLVEQCPIHFITPEPYIGHLGMNGAGDSQRVLEGERAY
jgi:NADPH-dependent 2,4-dienoyl-CoA reductase/sulfur reductase-like enzyme